MPAMSSHHPLVHVQAPISLHHPDLYGSRLAPLPPLPEETVGLPPVEGANRLPSLKPKKHKKHKHKHKKKHKNRSKTDVETSQAKDDSSSFNDRHHYTDPVPEPAFYIDVYTPPTTPIPPPTASKPKDDMQSPHEAESPTHPKGDADEDRSTQLAKKKKPWPLLIVVYLVSLIIVALITGLIVYFTFPDSQPTESNGSNDTDMEVFHEANSVQITYTVGRVTGRVTLIGEVYTSSLATSNSIEYMERQENICQQWTEIYSTHGFVLENCTVNNFANGSLLCDLILVVSSTLGGFQTSPAPDLPFALAGTAWATNYTVIFSEASTTSGVFFVSGTRYVFNACDENSCDQICTSRTPTEHYCGCYSGYQLMDDGTCN